MTGNLRGAAEPLRAVALARLEELVNMDSPSGDVASLTPVHETLARRLTELGLVVESISGPHGDHLIARGNSRTDVEHPGGAAGAVAAAGADATRGVVAAAGAGAAAGGRGILLIGHYDTVWPAGESATRPFCCEGGICSGPGTLDMKAGLVTIELALQLLGEAGLPLAQPLEVVIVADEEVSSTDGRRVVEAAIPRARAAFGLEPSFNDGALKTSRRGVIRIQLDVEGREAHSGLDAQLGISAINELLDQLARLRETIAAATGVVLNIGRIAGGTRPNVIAGRASAQLSFRTSSVAGEQTVRQWLAELQPGLDGATVTATVEAERPVWEDSGETPLFAHLQAVAGTVGQQLSGRPAGGAGDTNFTAAAGVPSLDGMGPWGAGAHALDEHVSLPALLQRAELLAALLATPLPQQL